MLILKLGPSSLVQLLVYLFVGVTAIAIGAIGYFGLSFTIIEATLAAAVAFTLAITLLERAVRVRSEDRLEKGIDDLSRLLSADAQAGQVLNQRINALTKTDAGNRLEVLEADISVLGTVMRQVAEAVSDLENEDASPDPPATTMATENAKFGTAPTVFVQPEPAIPLEMLRQALEQNRLTFHMQAIITLPRRQTYGYDLLPRLLLEDGDIADSQDFMPVHNGDDVIRQIELAGVEEAITIVRRARTSGDPVTLFVPISRHSLGDKVIRSQLTGLFDANRVVAERVVLRIADADWQSLTRAERVIVDEIAGKGIGFSLTKVMSLRLDYGNLASNGVSSIRVDTDQFISDSNSLTDFHTSDVADYVSRFGVELIAENITNEQQVLTMLEDGIKFAQGPHIAGPAPVRPDLMVRREVQGNNGQRARGA